MFALLLALQACVTVKDFGRGDCIEYKPLCAHQERDCEIDRKGCEICACRDIGKKPLDPRPGPTN